MTTIPRTTVDIILRTAKERGITLSLSANGEGLNVQGESGAITPKALATFKAYKAEIIAHLKKQQELEQQQLEAWLEQQAIKPLCSVCLEQGLETSALPDEYQGMMYCQSHHPYRPMILGAINAKMGGHCTITEIPPGTDMEAYKQQALQEIITKERTAREQQRQENRKREQNR